MSSRRPFPRSDASPSPPRRRRTVRFGPPDDNEIHLYERGAQDGDGDGDDWATEYTRSVAGDSTARHSAALPSYEVYELESPPGGGRPSLRRHVVTRPPGSVAHQPGENPFARRGDGAGVAVSPALNLREGRHQASTSSTEARLVQVSPNVTASVNINRPARSSRPDPRSVMYHSPPSYVPLPHIYRPGQRGPEHDPYPADYEAVSSEPGRERSRDRRVAEMEIRSADREELLLRLRGQELDQREARLRRMVGEVERLERRRLAEEERGDEARRRWNRHPDEELDSARRVELVLERLGPELERSRAPEEARRRLAEYRERDEMRKREAEERAAREKEREELAKSDAEIEALRKAQAEARQNSLNDDDDQAERLARLEKREQRLRLEKEMREAEERRAHEESLKRNAEYREKEAREEAERAKAAAELRAVRRAEQLSKENWENPERIEQEERFMKRLKEEMEIAKGRAEEEAARAHERRMKMETEEREKNEKEIAERRRLEEEAKYKTKVEIVLPPRPSSRSRSRSKSHSRSRSRGRRPTRTTETTVDMTPSTTYMEVIEDVGEAQEEVVIIQKPTSPTPSNDRTGSSARVSRSRSNSGASKSTQDSATSQSSYLPPDRKRQRSRSRIQYSESLPSDTDSDFDLDFTLKPSKGDLTDDASSTEFDVPNKDEQIPGVPWFHSNTTCYKIIHSQYIKQAGPTEQQGASGTLSVLYADGATHEKPLYRWIHFQHSEMNFEAFQEAAKSVTSIGDEDRSTVVEVLDAVRKQYTEELEVRHSISGQYLAPHCVQGSDALKQKFGSNRGRGIVSVCFPYFTLEKYQSSKAQGKSVLHPTRPLLQSYFASAKKEQDMQQAVCLMSSSKDERCFHVGQVWCTVAKSNLLLTCARASIDELMKDVLDAKEVPQSKPTGEATQSQGHVKIVETSAQLLWLLPRVECETFLELSCFFRDMGRGLDQAGLHVELSRYKKTLEPKEWMALLARLKGNDLRVDMNIVKKPSCNDDRQNNYDTEDEVDEDSQSGPTNLQESSATLNIDDPVLSAGQAATAQRAFTGSTKFDQSQPASQSGSAKSSPAYRQWSNVRDGDDVFHLFSWAEPQTATANIVISRDPDATSNVPSKIDGILNKAEQFLLTYKNDTKLKTAYQNTNGKSWAEVELSIRRRGDRADKRRSYARDNPRGQCRRFVIAVRKWYSFFVPANVDSTIDRKVAGAIYDIVKESFQDPGGRLSWFLDAMIALSHEMEKHQRLLSQGRPGLVSQEAVDELTKSYICTTAAIILAGSRYSGRAVIDQYLGRSRNFVLRGMDKCMADLKQTQFTDYEAVLPFGIMTLVVSRLLRDITSGKSDISKTYWDYYKLLELRIESEPYTRAHQGRMSMLKQEILAVLFNLNQQRKLVQQIKQTAASSKTESNDVRTTYTPAENWSAQDLVIDNCLSRIQAKISGFEELLDRTAGLQEWNLAQIENNTDRHNNAVYAFTIVTVIFLPLSFVTSFLGMNTSDIRDMGGKQWVFWAAGIPLTGIVISAALIWAGELGNLVQWVRQALGGSDGERLVDKGMNWQVSGKQSQGRKDWRPSAPPSIMAYPGSSYGRVGDDRRYHLSRTRTR